jgi:hypothetical protein
MIIDFNKELTSNIYDLTNISYKGIKVSNMNKAELTRAFKYYNFTNLLSKNNPKLEKNKKELNLYSIGLSIAPHVLNNNKTDNIIYDVCASSTKSCRSNCVIWQAGNPLYIPAKRKAMLNRKNMFTLNTNLFLACLLRSIELESIYSIKNKLVMTYRGNIASDIKWESIKILYNNKLTTMINVIDKFIQSTKLNNIDNISYDYTKHYNRKQNKNYHLAYSVTDKDINKSLTAIKNGLDLAIIFDTPKNKPLPKTFRIGNKVLKVFDGDKNDFIAENRKLLNESSIRGLRFKYKASHKKAMRIKSLDSAIKQGFVKQA